MTDQQTYPNPTVRTIGGAAGGSANVATSTYDGRASGGAGGGGGGVPESFCPADPAVLADLARVAEAIHRLRRTAEDALPNADLAEPHGYWSSVRGFVVEWTKTASDGRMWGVAARSHQDADMLIKMACDLYRTTWEQNRKTAEAVHAACLPLFTERANAFLDTLGEVYEQAGGSSWLLSAKPRSSASWWACATLPGGCTRRSNRWPARLACRLRR